MLSDTPSSRVGRRGFLGLVGLAGAAVVSPAALAGCRTQVDESSTNPSAATDAVLPKYQLKEYAKPDFPAPANGYEKIPALTKAFPTPPGSGSTFTAMTPLWGTIPPASGNKYYEAVNKALGSTVKFQISDGNTYGDKLAAILASPENVADWTSIPSWNYPARFGEAVDSLFTDLTPYLAGDKVLEYPNLANIPTDSWRYCVWNGKLFGLPFPDAGVPNALFYRDDLFEKKGIKDLPTTLDDLLALAKELTDAKAGVYGAEDLWNQAVIFNGVVEKWKLDGDKLVHRYETDEYRAALEWTTKLFASGAVHPDSVAGDANGKQRFESGKSLMMSDGLGGWHEALQRMLPTNPSYSQKPMPVIGANGDPVIWKGPAAGIFSFVKKGMDEVKVKELLKLADFLASPFGTEEFQLINSGVEGVHFTKDANGLPKPTPLGTKEIQPTYVFLVDPPVANAKVQYPGFVKEQSEWINDTFTWAKEPLFYGMNISEPSQYASIGQPIDDLQKDIVRGRKKMADLDKALETWRSAGGDKLREFYTKILDEGTPQ